MPVDIRKLLFNKQELRLAFQKYARDTNLNTPDSHVEGVEILDPSKNQVVDNDSMETLNAVLRYTSSDPHNPIRVHLNEEQMFEALVSMCRGLKIPLPKHSQKFLQKHKDGLALTIGMTEQDIRAARES